MNLARLHCAEICRLGIYSHAQPTGRGEGLGYSLLLLDRVPFFVHAFLIRRGGHAPIDKGSHAVEPWAATLGLLVALQVVNLDLLVCDSCGFVFHGKRDWAASHKEQGQRNSEYGFHGPPPSS
jgi:hypothetical protein